MKKIYGGESMRLLILSEKIHDEQEYAQTKYTPPYDITLDTGDLADLDFAFSVFDYDVSIIHITEPSYTYGYSHSLPKLLEDSKIALQQGRSVICLPNSRNFITQDSRGNRGMAAYEWLTYLGVVLLDNEGTDIKPSGPGRAQVIRDYLKYTTQYYQIVTEPKTDPEMRLAVVDETEIVVGLEYKPFEKGTLVILPPPDLSKDYYSFVSRLVDVARRYYERAQRRVPIGDSPDWLEGYLTDHAKDLTKQIENLRVEKEEYDKIAYILYGTGEELEASVALLLEKLGLRVEPQPRDANIDLTATHQSLGLGFAIEVKGITGTIQKDNDVVAKAWKYVQERAGAPEENDRLIVVANTERHLDPHQRMRDSFSREVVDLLGKNGVLLITAVQLYNLWKEVHEEQRLAADVIRHLHGSSGVLK